MTMKDNGLLALWLHMEPQHEGALDAWYDTEHTDIVLEVPGVHGSRRFKERDMAGADAPKYLIFYEMRDETVQPSAAYQQIADNPTPWSRYMRTLYEMQRRINYKLLSVHGGQASNAEKAMLMIRSEKIADIDLPWQTEFAFQASRIKGCRSAHVYRAMPNKHGLPGGISGTSPDEVLEIYSFDARDSDQALSWQELHRKYSEDRQASLKPLQYTVYVPTTAPRRNCREVLRQSESA
ncbi:MAG TPA: hypothetical protein VIP51_11140 [Eoetvoesiella sp.]